MLFYKPDPKAMDNTLDIIYPIQFGYTNILDRVFIIRCFNAEFSIHIHQDMKNLILFVKCLQ